MKKLILLALLGAFLSSNNAFSQYRETIVISEMQRMLKVGDSYYSPSIRGLSMLMNDIKSEDFDLYLKLKPEYDRINKKRIYSITTIGASSLVGTSLMYYGLVKTLDDAKSISLDENQTYYPTGTLIILSGGLVMGIGSAIGLLMHPNQADIFNFINLHNRNSQKKIDWGLGLHFDQYHDLGLKFTLKF